MKAIVYTDSAISAKDTTKAKSPSPWHKTTRPEAPEDSVKQAGDANERESESQKRSFNGQANSNSSGG